MKRDILSYENYLPTELTLKQFQKGSVFDNDSKFVICPIPALTITISSFLGSLSQFSTFLITASFEMSKSSDN